uniref:Uncharacterized protein n=1 Tax=Anopheles culicifacies TaxID=139723 RepID=A0A182ML68_9DIPT
MMHHLDFANGHRHVDGSLGMSGGTAGATMLHESFSSLVGNVPSAVDLNGADFLHHYSPAAVDYWSPVAYKNGTNPMKAMEGRASILINGTIVSRVTPDRLERHGD